MDTGRDLTAARWRKSSYSSDTGGECVECAPLDGTRWHKSLYSSDTGGQCVEVATAARPRVAVRDSKNPDGCALTVSPDAFTHFLAGLTSARA
jgi:hypothetical protein